MSKKYFGPRTLVHVCEHDAVSYGKHLVFRTLKDLGFVAHFRVRLEWNQAFSMMLAFGFKKLDLRMASAPQKINHAPVQALHQKQHDNSED